jgi:starvation-inducible DNA-binding protein
MTQPVLQNEVTDLAPETGLKDKTRVAVAEKLANAVADSYRLLVNTQGLHWNVEGPLFYSLHKLTEEQYQDLFEAIDDLAERIRALGLPAPASTAEFIERSAVSDMPADSALKARVEALIEANEGVAHRLREGVHLADKLADVKTAELLTERIGVHETNAWMLRATIAS